MIFIFEIRYDSVIRIQKTEIMPTIRSAYGTGGGNVPFIYSIQGTVIGRKDNAGPQGKGFAEDGEPMYTLDRVSGHGVAVIPIQDAREIEKHQNGTGIGNDGDPAYTLDRQQAPAVAMAYDEFNDSISDVHHTLRAGTKQSTGVIAPAPAMAFQLAGDRDNPTISTSDVAYCLPANPMSDRGQSILSSTVRRLTPMECERLQGFPDGWTDGQADSHRYKQMGNAVAVPVVQWIIDRIAK